METERSNSDSVAHFILELKTDDPHFNYYKSSLLQGVIMQQISPQYALILHEQGLKPYSQYIRSEDGRILWHIKTLTSTAFQEIICPLLRDEFQDFVLEHNGQKVQITGKTLQKKSIRDFMTEFYAMDADKWLPIEFLTPTAFKKDGKYHFFPDIYNIYHSCMRKFDAVSAGETFFNEETLEQLVQATEIASYHLRSVKFPLEGVKIPAFTGKITLAVHGNQTIRSFARLLLRFGEYSGVGIKTAMGMGAIAV